MDSEKKYERLFSQLMAYEQQIHERNQKRIRAGIKCICFVPLLFLALMFITGSSKIVFLILWIVSLFGIAAYLIGVEYLDYQLQENLNEIRDTEEEIDGLLPDTLMEAKENIQVKLQRLEAALNREEKEK